MRLMWQSMETMTEHDDPLSFCQACFFICYFCVYNLNRFLGYRFLKQAAECVKRGDLRLVPRNMVTKPAEPTEEDTERIGFLCELLSAEIDIMLVAGEQKSMLLGIETEFNDELPVST